jgi:hypothetical protein
LALKLTRTLPSQPIARNKRIKVSPAIHSLPLLQITRELKKDDVVKFPSQMLMIYLLENIYKCDLLAESPFLVFLGYIALNKSRNYIFMETDTLKFSGGLYNHWSKIG